MAESHRESQKNTECHGLSKKASNRYPEHAKRGERAEPCEAQSKVETETDRRGAREAKREWRRSRGRQKDTAVAHKQPHSSHTTATLQPHSSHTAATLQPHCSHTAATGSDRVVAGKRERVRKKGETELVKSAYRDRAIPPTSDASSHVRASAVKAVQHGARASQDHVIAKCAAQSKEAPRRRGSACTTPINAHVHATLPHWSSHPLQQSALAQQMTVTSESYRTWAALATAPAAQRPRHCV